MPTADAIAPCMKVMLGLSEALLKDVSDARWATLARGVQTNHPAWVYGHLSIYGDRILEALGRADLTKPRPEAYQALFRNKTQCLDDPKRTIYPPMEEVAAYFRDRYSAAMNAIRETRDDTFAKPNPVESLKDRVSTLGGLATFMGVFHPTMHLGQVSAWRRMMGLGSAM